MLNASGLCDVWPTGKSSNTSLDSAFLGRSGFRRARCRSSLSLCSRACSQSLIPFLSSLMHHDVPLIPAAKLPSSPNRLPLSIAAAGVLVHHHVLVTAASVFLRRRRRHVTRHARHQSLGVLPLGRRPVGRVAGLLCERMACLLTELCGLLRVVAGGKTVCANVRLPCGRGVA